MTTTREGGCQCRAVRYRVLGDPLTVYACHCADCQRRSGSAFAMTMLVSKNQIEVIQGRPAQYDYVEKDGRHRLGVFCGKCATRLWGESPRVSGVFFLPPGTLDDTSWVEPAAHVWTRSAQPWVSIPDSVPAFAQEAEDVSVLVSAWRDRRRPESEWARPKSSSRRR